MPSAAPLPEHVFPFRVYYEDTDAAGIVYYANYFKFAERARTEMLRARGFDHRQLDAKDGVAFADYLLPARLDDALEVRTRVTHVGGATLEADQDITRGDAVLTRLKVRLACINRAGRPARIPAAILAAFRSNP
jgi:acyl-CoA thioester hydrolase